MSAPRHREPPEGSSSTLFFLLILSNILMAHTILTAALYWQLEVVRCTRECLAAGSADCGPDPEEPKKKLPEDCLVFSLDSSDVHTLLDDVPTIQPSRQ